MAFVIYTWDKEIPNKTGKLGKITIVPYIFLQTLMRIYSYLRNRASRNYLIPILIRTRAWPLFVTKDKTTRHASVTPSWVVTGERWEGSKFKTN